MIAGPQTPDRCSTQLYSHPVSRMRDRALESTSLRHEPHQSQKGEFSGQAVEDLQGRAAVLRSQVPTGIPTPPGAWRTFGQGLNTAAWTSDGGGPGSLPPRGPLIRLQPWAKLNLSSCLKLSFLLSAKQKTLAAFNTELSNSYHEVLRIVHMILGGHQTADWILFH